jgi:3-oxoisoapionate kinase
MSLAACFYADDVTGATDALLQFERCGLRGRLRLDRGDPCDDAEAVDVVGVAGAARGLPTERIEAEVRPALEAFARLAPRVVQYKVCSTFDSSPGIGSIGRACEVAADVLEARIIPVAAAQPELGRYTLFSHHFARDAAGVVHRLDRHPTMAHHPVTPMRESNLVEVLREQTARLPVRGVDIVTLRGRSAWSAEPGAVVLDGLDDADLERAGDLVWLQATDAPVFAVGSGGLSMGLARGAAQVRAQVLGPVAPVPAVLAVSGSCAPQSAEQVRRALASGWEGIRADADPDSAIDRALAALDAGRSVVVYSAPELEAPADLDALLASFVAATLEATPVRRFVLAGGDTAGGVLRHLRAEAAELAGLAAGLPVCRLLSRRPELDGVEVVLKGGQVGGSDVFERVRRP